MKAKYYQNVKIMIAKAKVWIYVNKSLSSQNVAYFQEFKVTYLFHISK